METNTICMAKFCFQFEAKIELANNSAKVIQIYRHALNASQLKQILLGLSACDSQILK